MRNSVKHLKLYKVFSYFMSMSHANKILYIGAGLHIDPVFHLKETPEFIFIDTHPRNDCDSLNPNFDIGLYNSTFIYELEDKCYKHGFTIESINEIDKLYFQKIISLKQHIYYLCNKKPKFTNPTLIVFQNKETKQKLKYYVSTNIKFNMNKILRYDIESSDVIIVFGG